MPLLVTYAGRPVRKRENKNGAVLITFVSPIPGDHCDRQVVTQQDWERNSKEEFFTDSAAMPDKRELARKFAANHS